MSRLKSIVILGAGDYAKEIAWLIDDINAAHPEWHLLGFIDPLDAGRREHYGRPVFAGYGAVACLYPHPHPQPFFLCGMGKPAIRAKEASHASSLGWRAATLVHPTVIRAPFVSIGEGSAVGAGCVLAPYARVGRHCAINVQATLGHDSSLGDFCVVSPGARILGHAVLEDRVFIGANASVYPGRRLGAGATLGANSFLHFDLPAGESALGVAARAFLPPLRESA